jgi:type IV pilus biogenesis protein CpaD/CtpE
MRRTLVALVLILLAGCAAARPAAPSRASVSRPADSSPAAAVVVEEEEEEVHLTCATGSADTPCAFRPPR